MVLGIEASNILAGGGIVHLKELLGNAKPRDHDFEQVIVWAPQTTLDQLPERDWLQKQTHPWLNKSIVFRLLWLKFIFPSVAKKTIDVLFSPGANAVNFFPLVTMCQNLLPFDAAENKLYGLSWMRIRLFLLKYTQLKVFKQAQGIIFLTPSSLRYIPKRLNIENKAHVIPHGINSVFYHDTSLKRLNIPIKLLYVSIVDVYKHQSIVADAALNLIQKGYNLQLTLVGGQYAPAMKKLNKVLTLHADLAHKITYKQTVPYEELAAIYRAADIFVFASSCETFSLVLLEAMSSGLPIACSERDTLKDTLGDAGVYFDPYNKESIMIAIENLINDNELRISLSSKAYTKALTYSWSQCADRTFQYLSKIAKENSNS
ncbi:MAG: hypothetical protein JWO58_1663 [Chitinophagaceae bacterium]|nr:hypothetical protein [Chitinophagaceae bacterium]